MFLFVVIRGSTAPPFYGSCPPRSCRLVGKVQLRSDPAGPGTQTRPHLAAASALWIDAPVLVLVLVLLVTFRSAGTARSMPFVCGSQVASSLSCIISCGFSLSLSRLVNGTVLTHTHDDHRHGTARINSWPLSLSLFRSIYLFPLSLSSVRASRANKPVIDWPWPPAALRLRGLWGSSCLVAISLLLSAGNLQNKKMNETQKNKPPADGPPSRFMERARNASLWSHYRFEVRWSKA